VVLGERHIIKRPHDKPLAGRSLSSQSTADYPPEQRVAQTWLRSINREFRDDVFEGYLGHSESPR